MDTRPLKKAVDIIGGQTATGAALGVSQQAVSKWLRRSKAHRNGKKPVRVPPAEHVLKLERLTGGEVTRHDLRPDLYPRDQ